MDPIPIQTVGNMRADFFAAGIEIILALSAVCAFADKMNVGCLVMAYKPRESLEYRIPRRKRSPPFAPSAPS